MGSITSGPKSSQVVPQAPRPAAPEPATPPKVSKADGSDMVAVTGGTGPDTPRRRGRRGLTLAALLPSVFKPTIL